MIRSVDGFQKNLEGRCKKRFYISPQGFFENPFPLYVKNQVTKSIFFLPPNYFPPSPPHVTIITSRQPQIVCGTEAELCLPGL